MARILVTGGSKGIGKACAERLARNGHSLVVAAREGEALKETLEVLPPGHHTAVQLDVGDESSWAAAKGDIGDVEGLVHAAAVLGPIGAIDETSLSDLESAIRINLLGTFLAVRNCLPSVREADGAMVVFSGGGATSPLPRYDAYAATKAGVVRLVENLAQDGIRINAVAPGFVATDIHRGTIEAGPERAGADYFDSTASQVREGGVPPELAAELVAYLMSDAAKEVSGRLISAPWDPWKEEGFASSIAEDPDFGRLRRIDGQTYLRSE